MNVLDARYVRAKDPLVTVSELTTAASKNAVPVKRYKGFTSTGAVVLRDRCGTPKAEIPTRTLPLDVILGHDSNLHAGVLLNLSFNETLSQILHKFKSKCTSSLRSLLGLVPNFWVTHRIEKIMSFP
jgi:hypothetical protein